MDEVDVLTVTSLKLNPDVIGAPLESPLSITLQYVVNVAVKDPKWLLVFEADYTQKRASVLLHSEDCPNLPASASPHTLTINLNTIPIAGIKEKYLLQVGLLKLTLVANNGADNLTSINMVTQVSKDYICALECVCSSSSFRFFYFPRPFFNILKISP